MSEQHTIARDRLQRIVPFTMEKRADDDEGTDGLTLQGHAAVFNSPTLIDSWEGRFYEQIARGAFKKTFAERTPVLQFDHGMHPLIGSIPIGRIRSAKEDATGAFIKARLHDNWLIQPVRDAIAEESITGMSFRFSVVRDEWKREDGTPIKDDRELMDLLWSGDEIPTRTLREVKVPELGPVVFPAYTDTDVGVRSGRTIIDLGRLRQDPDARKDLARTLWLAEQADERLGLHGASELIERDDEDEDLPAREEDEPAQEGHSDEPPAASTAGVSHRSEPDEPPEGHSSPLPKMSPEFRRMTLDYIESKCQRAREAALIHASRIEDFERRRNER